MAEAPPKRPMVEVCVGSLADALVAASAGANRLELCSATEIGGLTPSIGTLELVLERVTLPVMVMIRPRAGGFCYDQDDFSTALRDAERALKLGAQGIVFGFLTRDGRIDAARCREFVELTGSRQTVFHRAFDFVPEPLDAADQLAQLGITRLLTSGQQPTAFDGALLIRQVVERCAARMEVLPGGGITSQSACEVVRATGCTQVHVGAGTRAEDGSLGANVALELVGAKYLERGSFRRVNGSLVSEIVERLSTIT